MSGLERVSRSTVAPLLDDKPKQIGDSGFKDLLKLKTEGLAQAEAPNALKFSTHAVERMRSRGISFDEKDMARLNSAIEKAEKKGSKETLVLMDNSALIVNIKNKTVVTAMDKAMMKENIFTNIDSTVVL